MQCKKANRQKGKKTKKTKKAKRQKDKKISQKRHFWSAKQEAENGIPRKSGETNLKAHKRPLERVFMTYRSIGTSWVPKAQSQMSKGQKDALEMDCPETSSCIYVYYMYVVSTVGGGVLGWDQTHCTGLRLIRAQWGRLYTSISHYIPVYGYIPVYSSIPCHTNLYHMQLHTHTGRVKYTFCSDLWTDA